MNEERESVRAEQTVSEMVAEVLARRAGALAEETGLSYEEAYEEAYAEVLETPAGRQLAGLAAGPHRHERAADWRAGLLRDREARRPARLRSPENGGVLAADGGHSWLGRYMSRLEGTDGREEYHALLRERFASLER